MSTRKALNKGLIMRRVSGRQSESGQPATSSTSPTTESDSAAHFPHESDVQASVFSDVFARVESGFNHFQSVVHDPAARVAAIAAVDKEVDAATQLLRSLLTRRNALAPSSLLPPEVLARVFHFLALEPPEDLGEPNLGWIKVTHVCQFWRQVALGDSSLWARISGNLTITKKWIPEMLARARNSPLHIDIDFDEGPRPDVLRMFPPHLSHTRELRLHNLYKSHYDDVRGICSREAPVLEHFEIGVSDTPPITFRDFGGRTLFRARAPRLRTFSISQILVPWSHIPRGQLTKLKIVLYEEVSDADASSQGDQLVDLLVNCPGLETLVLESCLPFQLTQLPHGQPIHLPRLSRLCLGGSSSRVTNLFKMLKLPSSTTLHFHCTSGNTSTDSHPLLPLLSAHLQSPTPIEFKNLNVTACCMDGLLHVIASTSLPSSRFRHSRVYANERDGDAEFVLSLEGLPGLGQWKNLLEPVCRMLHISNLESLSILTDIVDVNAINWVELFKHCTQVTTMQAFGSGTSSLVRALTAPKLTNTKPGRKGKKKRRDDRDGTPAQPARSTVIHAQAPIFPKLTALSLVRHDFSENEPPSGVLFNVIERGLQQRRSAHRPLETLNIESCTISAKRAQVLKKLVRELNWDGDEGTMDEFDDFGDYDSDFDPSFEPGARWQDFFIGTSQTEYDWWENYSDGY